MTRPSATRPLRVCSHCGCMFTPINTQMKYCKDACSRDAAKARYHIETGTKHLATATVGAMHEYLVVYDLLKRGFPVFRACSPACDCDLLINSDPKPARVEVRTGHRYKGNPRGMFPFAAKDVGKQDVLAIVYGDGIIEYFKVTALCPVQLTTVESSTVQRAYGQAQIGAPSMAS